MMREAGGVHEVVPPRDPGETCKARKSSVNFCLTAKAVMRTTQIQVSIEHIEAFCQRWNVAELSLFGSVLRDDFRPDSDVDILVHFGPGGSMTLEAIVGMRHELSSIFGGRQIDLVERRLVTNPFRRHEILTHREILYAA